MTARRRFEIPDPYDPANDAWWDLRDTLDTIARRAATIAAHARKACDQLWTGHDPDLEALATALDRWSWERSDVEVVAQAVRTAP